MQQDDHVRLLQQIPPYQKNRHDRAQYCVEIHKWTFRRKQRTYNYNTAWASRTVRTWWDQCRCRKAPRARMPSWLTHCVAWSMSPACWSDSQSSWSRAWPFPWLDQDVPADRLDWSQLLVFDSPPFSSYIFGNIWMQLYVYNHRKCSGAWDIAKIMRIKWMEIAPTHCGGSMQTKK